MLVSAPGEVDVFGPHRLGVVVREQRRMLVAPLAALEPAGETCVQLRPLRLRQAAVGDLPSERVLDRILALARQRRPGAPADEVTLGEQLEVGHAADELVDRTRPENTPDYRRRLQRRLLCRRQQVDASGEHRLHRVRDLKVRRQLLARPGAVAAHEHTAVDQRRQQLFDEKWIALRPLDDDVPHRRRQLDAEQLVEQLGRHRGRERVEKDRMPGPGGPALEQLRPPRGEHEQRPIHPGHERVEQLEQLVVGPVHVLNEHDRGTLASELAEELCPGVVQTLARPERVQLLARVEAERQAEVATATEPLGDDGRRIILQDAEVLAKDLGKRPVRGAVPV